MQAEPQERWAVVGGGFLGMTIALRLAQQGKSVSLFEVANSLGGLASAWQLGDIIWDRHYHVTLASDTYLRSLLRELGLDEGIRWAPARTGFYVDSKLHSISNALEFLRFSPLSLMERIRLGATIFHASRIKDWKALEKILAKDWLEKWSGTKVTEKIWVPLLRAKLGENYRTTSAAFIWATIARMYAARNGGMKTELFGYVPGGYARIVEDFQRLLSHERVRIRLGRRVTGITATTCGTLQLAVGDDTEAFDQVVVTTAAPLAARMCDQLTPTEKNQLTRIRYQGIICASLVLEQPLSDFYITNIADSRVPYTAVIEMSAFVERRYFGGRTLVYLPKYVPSDSEAFNLSDVQVRETFLCALEQMYPHFSRKSLLCFQISRVKYLLPITTLHYSDNLPRMSTSVAGLHLVNSAHIVNATLNVNETVRLAEAAATQLGKQSRVRGTTSKLIDNEFAEANR